MLDVFIVRAIYNTKYSRQGIQKRCVQGEDVEQKFHK
jgi:hypothetical protein